MATYYVDPAASGANNGSSWTDAWTSMASAASTVTAGNTVKMRGTQTLAANMTLGRSGSAASGFIKFVGCNASGDVDGTTFKLNCNSGAYSLYINGQDYVWLENIEVHSSSTNGIEVGSGHNYGVFVNCLSRNNGDAGWDCYYYTRSLFVACGAVSNSAEGFKRIYSNPLMFGCYAKDNGDRGFESEYAQAKCFVHCLATGNGADGFYDMDETAAFVGCVSDDNDGHGIAGDTNVDLLMVLGCRLTNNGADGSGYGLSLAGGRGAYGWNFLLNNQDGATNGALDAIGFKSDADTNETSGTEGYTNAAAGDYNLTSDATLRSVAIEID